MSTSPQGRISASCSSMLKIKLGMIIRIDTFKSASPQGRISASCSSMLKKKPWYDYKD